MKEKRFLICLSMFLPCFLSTIECSYGSGFGIFTQSASSLGQGSAVVAHSAGPSTIFFNPALMNKIDGTQIEAGTTIVAAQREFTNTSGGSLTAKEDFFFPSTFYLTSKVNERLSAGLGVFNPFGLGTDWGGVWEGRYLATKSRMETFDVNPAISIQVARWFAVAAGIDILILDTNLEKKINLNGLNANFLGGALGAGPLPDVTQKFSGNGTGIGYNIGMAIDLTKDISLGASYRSEIKVNVKGDLTFDQQIPGVLVNSAGKADLTLPPQVYAAVAYKGVDKLTLEAGMRWEGWSKFRQLRVDLDNGLSQTQARNWNDTFAINFGSEYRLNDRVKVLGGYLYGQNPVPDDTFEPAIPDSDTHLFSLGTELDFRPLRVAIAYGYQLQRDRTKNNNVGDPFQPGTGTANGRYSTDIHLVALSVGYSF